MSVSFPTHSQDSVTSKYVVPVISLISDEEGDGLDQPPALSKTKEIVGLSPSRSLKERAATEKPFDPVADMYYKEVMNHLTRKKRGCVAEPGAMKKRAAEINCVSFVVIDTSSDSSG